MQKSKCKGCGAEIVWALNPQTGKRVPIDLRPPIYRIIETKNGMECLFEDPGEDLLGVSHFATCPNADQFSGGGKK